MSAFWLALRGAAGVDAAYPRWEEERLDSSRTRPVPVLLVKGVLRPDVTPPRRRRSSGR